MAKPAPTSEQLIAIAAASAGKNIVIEAGAGTGKTSTLVGIAEDNPSRRFLYLAYNKAIATEAASKFPANVTCKTAHAVAFGTYGKPRLSRIQSRTAAHNPAFKFGKGTEGFVDMFSVKGYGAGEDRVTPRQVAVAVRKALDNFYNSRDDMPAWRHIEAPAELSGDDAVRFRKHVMPYVLGAWLDVCDLDGRLCAPYMSHDAYLKMWSLSKPQLGYDGILFDEAQDANPCIAVVVEAQRCQQIMVGDRAQAIYGWRGAVDAMQSFKADIRTQITQSFRFGQAIAEQANRWLKYTGSDLQITGFENIQSKVEQLSNPDAILCRTNAGVISAAMVEQKAGRKVCITGGTSKIESFVKAAIKLMEAEGGEARIEHPDLGLYKNWGEVLEAVETGEAEDIGPMVRLIDKYSTEDILDVCRASTTDKADVTVSTAHKAKGLEWNRVRIHSDFLPPKDEDGKISQTEAMLIYVAVTRAKLVLDNSALAWLDQFEAMTTEQEATA